MEFRKTYLSTSLRIPFTKQNFSTYFIKYNNIFIQLKRAKIENRFEANRYFFSILCVSTHQLLLMGIGNFYGFNHFKVSLDLIINLKKIKLTHIYNK